MKNWFKKKKVSDTTESIDFGDLYVDLKYSGQVILISDDYYLLKIDGNLIPQVKHLKLIAKKNTPEYDRLMDKLDFSTQTIRDMEIRSELRGRKLLKDISEGLEKTKNAESRTN